MAVLYEAFMESPVGKLRLVASDKGLRYVAFERDMGKHPALEGEFVVRDHKILQQTQKELSEYFEGKRKIFSVPLDMKGTVFQINAWRALTKIPYGKTKSYAEQAVLVGDANKARAVGMANNRNPISIIVPCHRVVGKDGKLVGYGGGLPRKAFLLALEKSPDYSRV
jgi:methylated-DNA-[protein]-cysteine S-methyltransferase